MEYKKILVISDLHMTNGKNPVTKTWAVTEDFFWDDDFRRFVEYFQDYSPSLLIINGDSFDFLQVLVFPTDEEKKIYGISPEEINEAYGLRTSESAAVFQVDKIFEGHPKFFEALTSFISKGNYVKILKGNHDIQLFWSKVQEKIITNLERIAAGDGKKLIRSNIEFLPWFFYIPGKLYVEHGNQYEYTTSFRNFLNPFLPFGYDGVSYQIELDLSSFLIRYFSNRMEPVNPLSDNIRPLSKYLGEFWKKHPYIFITAIGTAFRYVVKAFNKAKDMSKAGDKSIKIDKRNEELIRLEAAKFYSDPDKLKWFEENLFEINKMKAEPILSSGKINFLWNMLKSPLKGLLWVLPLYALLVVPDPFGFLRNVRDNPLLNILVKAKIPEILAVLILAIGLISLRTYLRKKKAKKTGSYRIEPKEIRFKIRSNAERIAELLKVKYVVFGHTHYADIKKFTNDAFYYNTGTWMGIFAPEEELYRNVKQFTFLLLEGVDAKLFHWDINQNLPKEVIIVDTEIPFTKDEDNIVKIIKSFFVKKI